MIIPVKTTLGGYDIVLERGALAKVGELLDLNRKVMIVSDDGVPEQYIDTVYGVCGEAHKVIIGKGETHKTLESFQMIADKMLEAGFSRKDCIVAVGGGVVGDLTGFVASAYKRGIDFYNIPTTSLSQVDSSIGGKTGVNYNNVKNIIGAFYQPSKVLIDPDVLKTLSARQVSNGLSEAVKMSLTSDPELFAIFEQKDSFDDDTIDKIIEKALLIKKSVVEKDEKEQGLRKILNFGHTIGHGIEAVCVSAGGEQEFYHGECVALGMTVMCSDEVKARLIPVLEKLGLPTSCKIDEEKVFEAVKQDKKANADGISAVFVPEVGKYKLVNITLDEVREIIKKF